MVLWQSCVYFVVSLLMLVQNTVALAKHVDQYFVLLQCLNDASDIWPVKYNCLAILESQIYKKNLCG